MNLLKAALSSVNTPVSLGLLPLAEIQ